MEERHNKSTSLMEKRFQEMERRFIKRLDALLHMPSQSSDSSLLAYLLVQDGRNNRKQPAVGPPGLPGPKGDQGAIGRPGAKGSQGAKGEKGQEGAEKSGVKYVRWGRTICPGSADIVYKGRMGGERYTHPGGGVNILCLPNNPKYGKYKDGQQNAGFVYGAEYELQFNPFKKNLHNHDAPCVVCYVKSRGSMLLMPARNDCPSGWNEEYHGYLMTAHYSEKNQKDFICVDEDAEHVPGSKRSDNGALLYPVEGQCVSLPCGPYVAGRELTCAVCTK